MARKIRLFSPYDPIRLATILKEEMDRKWTREEKKSGRVMGGGTEADIELRVARWKRRNDFASRLYGSMEPHKAGTLIEAKIGKAKGLGCFMAAWLGFVGFFLFMALIIVFASDDAPVQFKLIFTGIPLVMFVGGLALFRFGRKGAAGDEERILAFLSDKVQARQISSLD